MKKIVSVLFAVLLVLELSVPVYAENTWYYINDLKMAVPVSDDMDLLSRDMSADDPLLAKLGQTRETILAVFNKNNIYLQLWENDLSSVINISMTSSSYKNMSSFNETEWSSFISSIIDEFDYADVSKIIVYPSPESTFVQFSIYANNGYNNIYSYYYVTVYQGKKIVIQLYAQNGAPTSNQQAAFKSFVDGIRFGNEEEIFDSSSEETDTGTTSAFTYTDKPVNTSFTVPANWSQEPVTGTDPYVTAVFESNEDEDAVIVYGSEDQWSDYSSLDGITRADINNDYFTEKEVGDQFEFIAEVSVKYVDGVKYFTFKTRSGNQVSTSMIMFHNAVFYWFEFYGDENNKYYNDFISLIKSVKYPPVSTSASSPSTFPGNTSPTSTPAASANTPVSSDTKAGGSAAAALQNFNKQNSWLYILCAAVIFALPIIIYRYAIRKRPVDPKNALMIVLIYGISSIALLSLGTVLLNGSWGAVGVVLIFHIGSYFLLTGGPQKAEPIQIISPEPTSYSPYPYAQDQTPFGTITQPADQSVPNQNAAQEQTIFCEMCGMRLTPGSKFCPNCGEKVESGLEGRDEN